jgi:alanine dehydrogenase
VTLLLDDDAVQAVFGWTTAIQAVRDAYLADCEPGRYPARTIARGGPVSMRVLSGIPGGSDLMGLKIIAGTRSTRRFSYLIALFDQRSAELVALLDANSVTGYRTAATSALAVDLLAPRGPLTVAAIGSGFEAKKHVRALAAIRPLAEVTVYSPSQESRARFAAELADLGAPINPKDTAEAAVASATVVVCAARSRDETPILRGAWLRPGMTVVSIGSTVPSQREVDPEVIARAGVVIADVVEEVLGETGDLITARAAGVDAAGKTASLADLVAGRHPGRANAEQIVLYKSVGCALQDLAVAGACLSAAKSRGLAQQLPITIQPVSK